MAITADETHAIHLTRFFLETTDEQHVAKGGEFLLRAERGVRRGCVLSVPRRGFAADGGGYGGHAKPLSNGGGGESNKNSAASKGKRAPGHCGGSVRPGRSSRHLAKIRGAWTIPCGKSVAGKAKKNPVTIAAVSAPLAKIVSRGHVWRTCQPGEAIT
jgi:hypothetical protein